MAEFTLNFNQFLFFCVFLTSALMINRKQVEPPLSESMTLFRRPLHAECIGQLYNLDSTVIYIPRCAGAAGDSITHQLMP